MLVPRRCLLIAATIAALGCRKGPEAPHGAPALIAVLWEVKGVPTRVWSRDADAAVAPVVPPQGTRVDFVFDHSLDGARVEDTIDGMEVPKANPPISAGWPDSDTVMSDPPFSTAVLYNSLPDWGPGTTYAFLTPRPAGFPAATAITFTLDPNGLTSVYGEPMDGPTAITVNTGAFTVSLPNGSATMPPTYRVPIAFSTRAPHDQTLKPFIHVLAGVVPLPFDLKNDNGDTTLIYIIPTPTGCTGWPVDTEITIFADQGLPDAFGRPMAMPVAGRFVTSSIGGCGGVDGGASDAAPPDAPTPDGGTDDGGATDAPQSN
jgi:hypothetical protein